MIQNMEIKKKMANVISENSTLLALQIVKQQNNS